MILSGEFGSDIPNHAERDVDDETPIDVPDEVKLSDNIFLFPNRTIGNHDNVYEGEIRSSVFDARPCVIKFSEISAQNIREAEILTKLGSHTNVIAMIQAGTYNDVFGDRFYIALDKCHHENLRQYFANRRDAGSEFDLDQALDFTKQIITGVMYIHDNNVIHLDLKPSNILISQNLSLIKVADFGLSIKVKSSKSKVLVKGQFGTNGYRPIESFGNGEVSMRSDIFSLGVLLLHVLSNGNDVFGCDEHTFIHNVMNDITNTSGLLISNPVATEHLIKCMVSKERCRRPTIWEVSDHPCWSGKEVECNFEYSGNDEIDDNVPRKAAAETSKAVSPSDIERDRSFLAKMREMGYNRKPMIAIFDDKSKQLHRFDPVNKTLTKMHKLPKYDFMVDSLTLGEYIYAIFSDSHSYLLYKLEYCDVMTTWETIRLPDWIIGGSGYPRFAASSDAIFLVGYRSVSQYEPSSREWKRLPDAPEDWYQAFVYSNGFLYCIGDRRSQSSKSSYRLDLKTMEWKGIADMSSESPWTVAATDYEGNIYVAGYDIDDTSHIKKYDPEVDQWTILTTTQRTKYWITSVLTINGDLYLVRHDGHIQKYDLKKNELSIVASYPGMEFRHAALVKMSE